MFSIIRSICPAALALMATAGLAQADEVRLISVGGVKSALDPIVADFTKTTGHTVKYTVGSPLSVSQKLAAGEAFDVVVQSAPAMNDLAAANGLKAETRAPVARGGIGIAISQSATAPDVSTPEAFKKTLASAKSIGVGDPAMPNGSGGVIQKILGASGIMDEIKPRVKVVGLDPGQEMIAKGELDLGLVNASEVRSFVKFGGYVPAPLQSYTNYEVAILAKSDSASGAGALAKTLSGGDAAKHWTAARLEPAAK